MENCRGRPIAEPCAGPAVPIGPTRGILTPLMTRNGGCRGTKHKRDEYGNGEAFSGAPTLIRHDSRSDKVLRTHGLQVVLYRAVTGRAPPHLSSLAWLSTIPPLPKYVLLRHEITFENILNAVPVGKHACSFHNSAAQCACASQSITPFISLHPRPHSRYSQ